MTKSNQRRMILYPAAILVVSALAFLTLQSRAREQRALVATLQNGGELMAKVGLFDKAAENAQRILKMDTPPHLYARLLLAYTYQRTDRFDESIREYQHALEWTENPEQRQYLELVLADVYRQAKDYDGARSRLDRYRAAYGEQPEAALVRGQVHADLGELEVASSWFRKAATARPTVKGSHLALASTYLKLGDKSRALEALETVAEGERRTHGVWYAIAELRRDLGDRDGARKALRTALATDPTSTRRRLQKDAQAWGDLPGGLKPDRSEVEG